MRVCDERGGERTGDEGEGGGDLYQRGCVWLVCVGGGGEVGVVPC